MPRGLPRSQTHTQSLQPRKMTPEQRKRLRLLTIPAPIDCWSGRGRDAAAPSLTTGKHHGAYGKPQFALHRLAYADYQHRGAFHSAINCVQPTTLLYA
ncbi:hypothetical protein BASA81_006370 [Batrachochytrium salamandrivorans]|nr:hypothetical protein BASA81_006370 [Batrachochytrium salamandrivorans]